MNPTQEQEQALAAFATGENVAIRALAGTGKTSTLELIANSTTRRGHYLAFNKSIAAEVQGRFGENMTASTFHSLAFRNVMMPEPRFIARQNAGRQSGGQLAKRLGIGRSINVKLADETVRVLQPSWLAGHILRAVTEFCNSDEAAPTVRHFPYIDGIDEPGAWKNNNEVSRAMASYLVKAWADITSPTGTLPFGFGHYLKMWALDSPHIDADFILVDEAQDMNAVQIGIVLAQTHAQIVVVGDDYQTIYTWRGAVNALDKIPVQHNTYLTKSFRFGPAVAETANVLLERLGSPIKLVGHDPIVSTVGPLAGAKAILCRTNAEAVSTSLREQQSGRKVHLVGGAGDVLRFARGVIDLTTKGWSSHPDLQIFKTWAQVQEYVDQDSQGGDLKQLVKLIDTYSAETVVEVCEASVSEKRADVIVSTAHKSKGRQWESVRIASDFPNPNDTKREVSDEEWRLAYVACTRAQLALDPSGIDGFLNPLVRAAA